MVDNLSVAEADPFAQFDTDSDPFAQYDTDSPARPESSTVGAFARGAERSIVPTLTSLPAAGAGAEIGAAVGAIGGPVGAAVGGFVGGLAGMFGGAYVGSEAQDFALSKMPEDMKASMGLSDEQRLVDEQKHPYASQIGGLIPYLVTASPFSPKVAKEAETALGRFMQDWRTQKAAGGLMMGGWELGQEAIHDEIDWTKVAVATGTGLIFNHQNRIGTKLMGAGARPVQRLTGGVEEMPPAPGGQMDAGLFSPREMSRDIFDPTLREANAVGVVGPGVSESTYMGNKPRDPNLELFSQQLVDEERAMLYGPQKPDAATITATARKMEPELFAERDALEEQATAIRSEIDAYRKPSVDQYNELRSQRSSLEKELEQTKNKAEKRRLRTEIRLLTNDIDATWSRMSGEGEMDATLTRAYRDLAEVSSKIREQGRDIAAAHRRAAETLAVPDMTMELPVDEAAMTGETGIAPELFTGARGASQPAATQSKPTMTEAMSASGRDDRKRVFQLARQELLNAGRPVEEADAGAQVIAARYVARAGNFKGGELGTPLELYIADHAKITEWKRGGPPSGGSQTPVAPAPSSEAVAATETMRQADAAVSAEQASVAGRLPEAPAQEAPQVEGAVSVMPEAAAEWSRLSANTQEKSSSAGFIKWDRLRSGNPNRQRATKDWIAGNIVDAGFVKDLLVVDKNDDGTFLLLGKPDKTGQSQSYTYEPHKGIFKNEKVDFLSVTQAFRSLPKEAARVELPQNIIAPQEPLTGALQPAPVGPKVGDRLVIAGVSYKIDAIDERIAKLTPTRKKDNAASLTFPRQAVEKMLADYVAPQVAVEGEKITLNGEVLDGKLAEAIRAKLAEPGGASAEVASGRLPESPDMAALRERMRGEAMSDEYPVREELLPQPQARPEAPQPETVAKQEVYYDELGEPMYPMTPDSPMSSKEAAELAKLVGRQYAPPRPQTLLGFIRGLGGVKDSGGDLRSQNVSRRFPGLINEKTGLPLDRAREAAAEQGYLPEDSTPDDLVQLLLTDEPVYSKRDAGQVEEYNRYQESLRVTREYKQAAEYIKEKYPTTHPKIADDAAMRMAYDNLDVIEAIEMASDSVVIERSAPVEPEDNIGEIFDAWASERSPKSNANEKGQGSAPAEPGRRASEVSAGDTGASPEGAGGFSYEAGAEGKAQAVVPGAERISDRALAEKRANEPMRGGNAPAGGMFDEGNTNQGDLFQKSGKGKAERALGAYLKDVKEIWLKPEANPSTIIHESGHDFLEQMKRDVEHPAAPEQLKADMDTVKRWVGWKDGQSDFSTRQHEKFARGFERYFFDGIAPSQELAGVFQRFSNWLRQVYKAALGLKTPTEITPEIRAVFDRLLSNEPERVTVGVETSGRRTIADIHEAEAVTAPAERVGSMADRMSAERNNFAVELNEGVRNELAAAADRSGVGRDAAGIATAGENSAGGMAENSSGRGTVARSSARGASDGSQSGGRSQAETATGGAGRGAGGAAGRDDGSFAREGQYVDKAGNIRLENLTNEKSLRAAMREIAFGENGFIEARRGVISDVQALSLAEELGLDGAEALVNNWMRGQAFNSEEIMALRLLVRDSAGDVFNKAQAVKNSGGDWRAVRDYAVAKERHTAIQRTVSGATAEWGRAGRAFRNISGDLKAKAIQKIMRQGTGQSLFQLRDEANLLAGLENEQAVNRFIRDAEKPNFLRRLQEYWINGLISGPSTHTTYMVGNDTLALYRAIPETMLRAALGEVRALRGGEIDPYQRVRFGEVWQQILGLAEGTAPAIKAAGQSMRVGVTTLLPNENMRTLPGLQPGQEFVQAPKLDKEYSLKQAVPDLFGVIRGLREGVMAYGQALTRGVEGEPLFGWKYSPLGVIPDFAVRGVTVAPIGTAARLPSRAISGIHAFHRVQFYFMELNAEAFRMASAELEQGIIRPEDFDRRVADLKLNPKFEMIQRASETATEGTMMGQGGEFTRKLSALLNTDLAGAPLLKFIDPFVHITSQVIGQAIVKRTPLAILSKEARADLAGKNGQLAQDKAIARVMAGTGLILAIGAAVEEGYITGGGPSDPAEAAVWGKIHRPYSVKIGDTWYGYHRLGVLGLLMGVAADMTEFAGIAGKEDMSKSASALLEAFYHNIFEESFLRGPSELFRAVENPDRYGPQWVRNFASSFTPYSVGMSQVTRAVDPYSRHARTIVDAFKQKNPFWSQDLYARRDLWGEPIRNPDAFPAPGLTAITAVQGSKDPVDLEMYRLGIHKAQVERKILGIQLTDQEYDDYQRIAGRLVKMQLDQMVNSERWYNAPDGYKRETLEKAINDNRETARNMMMMKYQHIRGDAYAAKASRLRGDDLTARQ